MIVAVTANNVALMWVAIEATTIVSAIAIPFERSKASVEASWKYLLICSVGIALALLGTFFLATAQVAGAGPTTLMLPDLVAHAQHVVAPTGPNGDDAMHAPAAFRVLR